MTDTLIGRPPPTPEGGRRVRRPLVVATPPRTWLTTLGATAPLIVAAALTVLGVALARPVAVAIAGAVVLSWVLGRQRLAPAPPAPPHLRAGPAEAPPPGSEEGVRYPSVIETDGPLRVRVSAPGFRSVTALIAAGRSEVAFHSHRNGIMPRVQVDWIAVGGDGLWESAPASLEGPAVVVVPSPRPLPPLPVPGHLVGMTGTHRSRRRGEGEDLHDLAPFTPGDRLRSVDWRVTARRGTTDPRVGTQLWVRRRLADAEATMVVVLDSRDDVGIDVGTWAGGRPPRVDEATSLDLARQAAASYARAWVERGDRVGFTDLAVRVRPVPPGAGTRHLARVLQAIAVSAPAGDPRRLVRAPRVTAGALVVVVSTFLDDDSAVAARGWALLGHPVIAVDVLPQPHLGRLEEAERLAARVVLLERSMRLVGLRRAGIDVVEWRR